MAESHGVMRLDHARFIWYDAVNKGEKMEVHEVKILAEKAISLLSNSDLYKSGMVTNDKLKYVAEIEVLKALLQNVIYWSNILIEKHKIQELDQVDDSIF